MQWRVRDHLRSNVVGYLALFFAVSGGVAWATHPGGANTIGSTDIINGEVRNVDIAQTAVGNARLADDAVNSRKVADQTLTGLDIDDDSLGREDIANEAIGDVEDELGDEDEIEDGTVDEQDVVHPFDADTVRGSLLKVTSSSIPANGADIEFGADMELHMGCVGGQAKLSVTNLSTVDATAFLDNNGAANPVVEQLAPGATTTVHDTAATDFVVFHANSDFGVERVGATYFIGVDEVTGPNNSCLFWTTGIATDQS